MREEWACMSDYQPQVCYESIIRDGLIENITSSCQLIHDTSEKAPLFVLAGPSQKLTSAPVSPMSALALPFGEN